MPMINERVFKSSFTAATISPMDVRSPQYKRYFLPSATTEYPSYHQVAAVVVEIIKNIVIKGTNHCYPSSDNGLSGIFTGLTESAFATGGKIKLPYWVAPLGTPRGWFHCPAAVLVGISPP